LLNVILVFVFVLVLVFVFVLILILVFIITTLLTLVVEIIFTFVLVILRSADGQRSYKKQARSVELQNPSLSYLFASPTLPLRAFFSSALFLHEPNNVDVLRFQVSY